ncbi:MAG: FAD-binding protein [Spirochaetaceae bacterium]|nr:MAG: FAD-binding protein [Spirochaetaceae bacterium]
MPDAGGLWYTLVIMRENTSFKPLAPEVLSELKNAVGADNVIADGSKKLRRYGHDQVADDPDSRAPEAVVFASSTADVVKVMEIANRAHVAVTPRGGGSGLSGGAVPIFGGIVLSTEKMNEIIEVDTENLVAVVEPGVVTSTLDRVLEPHGLFFAGYPMSEEFCTVGGNVAENAGGGRAVKYGVTGRYIIGLEVVTPAGNVMVLGGKRLKDVTGYDLVSLIVGSEGTLAIVTKIFIRLMPRPVHRSALLAFFPDTTMAISTLPRIISEHRIIPTSAEYADAFCLREACVMVHETLPYDTAGAMMLFESDGPDASIVDREIGRIESVCRAAGALHTYRADTEKTAARFWKIRKQIPWALKHHAKLNAMEDIVVPVASIPAMVRDIARIADEHSIRIPVFGHAADGNLHATVLADATDTEQSFRERLVPVLERLYTAAAGHGGTISGEHGIGHKRARYLPIVMSQYQIDIFRGIKAVFDPNGILNPGKIVVADDQGGR